MHVREEPGKPTASTMFKFISFYSQKEEQKRKRQKQLAALFSLSVRRMNQNECDQGVVNKFLTPSR